MTDTPTKPLSERFATELVRPRNALSDGSILVALVVDNADAILAALRLAESHPSAIREAVEREREACAKIAEGDREKCKARGSAVPSETHQDMWMACADTGRQIAVAIRARGEEKGNV